MRGNRGNRIVNKELVQCIECKTQFLMSKHHIRNKLLMNAPFLCAPCRNRLWHVEYQKKSVEVKLGKFNEVLEINGCRLKPFKPLKGRIGRCQDYFYCEHAWSCLSAAAERMWPGWTAEKG